MWAQTHHKTTRNKAGDRICRQVDMVASFSMLSSNSTQKTKGEKTKEKRKKGQLVTNPLKYRRGVNQQGSTANRPNQINRAPPILSMYFIPVFPKSHLALAYIAAPPPQYGLITRPHQLHWHQRTTPYLPQTLVLLRQP